MEFVRFVIDYWFFMEVSSFDIIVFGFLLIFGNNLDICIFVFDF